MISALPPRWCRADLLVLPEATGYPTGWFMLGGRRVLGARTAVFGHGTDFARPEREDIAERLNRLRMRQLDWWFAYNAISADAVRERGMPAGRVSEVQNTLDTDGLIATAREMTDAHRARLRKQLGIGTGPLGVFVGALHPEKRPSTLIEAADDIRSQVADFSLLVMGDGPCAHEIREAARDRPWLRHLPGDVSDQRARIWALADVALYPAWAGLAINEALALGVPPVIGSGWPHPPEATYVVHGVNGIVVDGADVSTYATAVVALLNDPTRRARLSANARETGAQLTVAAMARRFADGVQAALEQAPRRRVVGEAS